MSSVAIWYSPLEAGHTEDVSIDLHLNLWKVPGKHQRYHRFLDIGVKLNDTSLVSTINIFVPFTLHRNNILDLGNKLAHDSSLVCSIFNENYKTVSDPSSKFVSVTDASGKTVFVVYELSLDDLDVETKFNGAIIRIASPQCDGPIYFRIRITGNYCESLITSKSPSNSLLQSAFSKLEIVDFRVNQVRDLDRSLLEQISREGELTLRKSHFFYMISSNEDLMNFHAPYINCRGLEKDRWKKYIGQNDIQDDERMLAYHWKFKAEEDISILIKSKFESNHWLTIIMYILFLGLLSVVFNLFSSGVYDLIKGS